MRNKTAILLALSVSMGIAVTGCGEGSKNSQDTGVQMNEIQEDTGSSETIDEHAGSDETVSRNKNGVLGEDFDQINEDLQEKTNDIVENVEKLLEEKKEGN